MYDSTGKEMFSDYVQQFVSIQPMSLNIYADRHDQNYFYDSINFPINKEAFIKSW